MPCTLLSVFWHLTSDIRLPPSGFFIVPHPSAAIIPLPSVSPFRPLTSDLRPLPSDFVPFPTSDLRLLTSSFTFVPHPSAAIVHRPSSLGFALRPSSCFLPRPCLPPQTFRKPFALLHRPKALPLAREISARKKRSEFHRARFCFEESVKS